MTPIEQAIEAMEAALSDDQPYIVKCKLALAALRGKPADIDWKDQYEFERGRAQMWIAKYEKDIGPLQRACAQGQPDHREAETVCAEAYQAVGVMLSDLGIFDTPQATKLLDNLSQAKMVHTDVLPWELAKPDHSDLVKRLRSFDFGASDVDQWIEIMDEAADALEGKAIGETME